METNLSCSVLSRMEMNQSTIDCRKKESALMMILGMLPVSNHPPGSNLITTVIRHSWE